MSIFKAEYGNADGSIVKATYDDGMEWFLPQPCETYHAADLEHFLAAGGNIGPYTPPVAPAPPTPEEKLAKAGLTVDELKDLLGIT